MTENDKADGRPPIDPPAGDQPPGAATSGDAAPDTVGAPGEPDVSQAAVEFAEPELGEAKISPETADSVDLDKVAAEAAEVEREAERSTQLGAAEVISSVPPADVDFGMPDAGRGPSVRAEPSAPAAPAAPGPAAGPHRVGPGIDDGSGWRRPEARWQQSATPWQPRANAWQSPGQVAQGEADAAAASAAAGQPQGRPPVPSAPGKAVDSQVWQQAPAPDPGKQQGNKGKLLIVLGVVVVGLVLVALLIWLLLGLFSGGSQAGAPAATATAASAAVANEAAVIVPRATPLDWLAGDCLRGYAGINTPADVVVCSSPHSAQVVGSSVYTESADFPGEEVLKARAAAECQSVRYTDATKAYKGLKEFKAYPSKETWDTSKDRRIDCLVVDPAGDNLTRSLIP